MRGEVLVYGLGRSGLAVLRRLGKESRTAFFELREGGADVAEALDLGSRRAAAPSASESGQDYDYDLVIAAPGVPIDHPDLNALRSRGALVIGEVEWVWRTTPGVYIGISGTAGKGSVTRWTADTLAAAGMDAVAGGNFEPALAAVARPGAVHVVEMSSFQLERCPTFKPDVAVLLNLGEDHIDRHGSVSAYHAAKRNLLANLGAGTTFVANDDDEIMRLWAAEADAAGVNVRRFSLTHEADAYRNLGGRLVMDGAPLVHSDELYVLGEHQVANALAVALTCAAVGADPSAITAGLRAFTGLPGRYSAAGQVGGVRFLEDSIATRPLAVAAALRSTPKPLVWLAGGQAKGADVSGLAGLVAEKVDLLVALGASGPALQAAFGDLVPTVLVSEPRGRPAMRAAVAAALEHLNAHHGGAGNVLLAPLAASFDQFEDYADRAAAFREAVAANAANARRPPLEADA
ncbi:MAG TPA: UDP-N-acetylmuramoyl-L-alanine--D-glutamate ligase [Trueperaceae bacterium]|nr:UDP-N-acetylmuramoyl-L-alanine--D-glutamate ligase [Trueperaceae bacterium]